MLSFRYDFNFFEIPYAIVLSAKKLDPSLVSRSAFASFCLVLMHPASTFPLLCLCVPNKQIEARHLVRARRIPGHPEPS